MPRELPVWVKEDNKNKKREKLIKRIIIAISTLLALALVGGVALLIHNGSEKKNNKSMVIGKMTPKNVAKDGSLHIITNGESNAQSKVNEGGVRTVMYFDPMCPGCGITDRALHDEYSKLVNNKTIDLYMNPVAFLNGSSTDIYSGRAVNAILTVSENDPKNTFKFITELYKEGVQPHEAAGYSPVSDGDLAKTAKSVGVNEATANKFKDHLYLQWIDNHTNRLNSQAKNIFPEGISTPTILMGGKTFNESGDPTNFTKVDLNGNTPIFQAFTQTLNTVKTKESK